jgi:pimeloyl-ACP methyl ester carboxylesterase
MEHHIREHEDTIDNKPIRYLLDYKVESKNLIVFVHGLACTKDTFRHAFEGRYFPDCSLLSMDMIGFGDSSKPADDSYSMEEQAAICDVLIANHSHPNLHVVAHSMGAAVALLLSARTLERVRSFANIEGNLIGEDCDMLSRRIAERSYDEYESRMFGKHEARFRNDILLRFDSTTPRAAYCSSVSLVKWSDSGELLRRYKELRCRKMYFWGERNATMPVLDRLRADEKCMISSSGHAMMIENPEEFYAKLAGFIAQAI